MARKSLKQLAEDYNNLLKKYNSLMENIAEGVWCFEVEEPVPVDMPEDEMIEQFFKKGYLAECNDIMAKMYGFERREDILGARLPDMLIPDDPRNIEYLRSFIRNGFRLVNGETYEKDREGNLHIFLNNLIGEIENGKLVRAWGTQREITELREKERSLEESERRFRKLFENMTEGQVILELIEGERRKMDFLVVDMNSAFERYLNIKKENYIGRKLSEFHNLRYFPDYEEICRIRDVQKTVSFEVYFSFVDKYFQVSIYHILGNLFGFAFLDVTDARKIMRRNIFLNKFLLAIRNVNQLIVKERDREKLIKGICGHLMETRFFRRVWVSLMDKEGKLICNAMCGWKDEVSKFVEENVREKGFPGCIRGAFAKGDVVQVKSLDEVCKGCYLADYCKGFYSYCYPLKHGKKVFGALMASSDENIFESKEYKELFVEVGMDISYALHALEEEDKRREAEERIRHYSEQIEKFSMISADILSVRDERELFKLVCDSIVEISDFQRLLLYTFKSEPPYREILGYVGVDEKAIERLKKAEVSRDHLKRIFEKGIRLGKQSCYLPHTMKDILDQRFVDYGKHEYEPGKGRWHKEDNLFVALLDKEGEMIGMISLDDSKSGLVPTDETVRPIEIFANFISQVILMRKVEKEAQQMQESLAHFEKIRALGEMAGGVAHDFNNVLSAILGRAQILKRFDLPTEVKHGLELIEKAALDGAETVRRIQDFTRLRKDRHFTVVDINGVIADAVRYLKAKWKDEAEEKGIYFNIVKNFGKVSKVEGSPSELREVFTNIISNALDAMPKGGSITIDTFEHGDDVVISIRDTGIGMSEEVQKRIFDPFFTTKGVKGSGLGMSISYGIISRHGGKIDVKSQLGVGTTVTVTLPAARVQVVEKREVERPVEKPEVAISKILVVDDEEGPRSLLYDILKLLNYEVVTAKDGIEALEIFKNDPEIDVIFTDLGMPKVSGWELSREIRKLREDVVIVLITGWGTQIDDKKIKEHGIDRILSKPFEFSQIQEIAIQCSRIKEEKLKRKNKN